MPIDANEIVAYGCANHAEDDTSTQGGAIDLAKKVAMVPMAANDTVDVLSSSGSDTTQTVTITGRLASGVIDTEVYNLNGTTPDTGAKTFNRILKVVMSATAVGTVTVRRSSAGPTVCTLEPGITSVRTLGYNAASGASPKSIYEKFFLKNLDSVLAVTSATIKLAVEPANIADALLAVEDAVNDTGTSTNRLTSPSGVSTFRQLDVTEPVPGGSLGPTQAIGVWLRIDLAGDNVAVLDDWQVTLAGSAI